MSSLFRQFWEWYERHKTPTTLLTTGLFFLQIIHLTWLTLHVVCMRIFGVSFWQLNEIFQTLIIVVDYTEIPALIGTTLLYASDFRKKFDWKTVLFLFFLNSQWLHLFWITDEFVIRQFMGTPVIGLPVWLAWVAIAIDYLEVPIIIDTVRRSYRIVMKKK